jgi:ABC-type lipoprotein export system ATPase subunit
MILKTSRELKLNILREIFNQTNPFGLDDDGRIFMNFLESIWNLRSMPSEDERFDDAYGDILQHIVNNNDWDYEYLFFERLQILKDDERFVDFLNKIIHPDLRVNEESIMNYYYLINPFLDKENLIYILVSYTDGGLPVYHISEKVEGESLYAGIKKNDIPFFVEFSPNGRADFLSSISKVEEFPSFVLALNRGWNDYDIISDFYLYYFPNSGYEYEIGHVKIIHKDEIDISKKIPTKFTSLGDMFCSLGQEMRYYNKLKEVLGVNFESVLYALRDAAFFPVIHESFEKNDNFKTSLIRFNEQERLLREAKYRVYDYDLSNLYSFKYHFKPKFADNELDIDFEFKNNQNAYERIFALIGKNGTGKTQLITSLPIDIAKRNNDNFEPKTPLFSKVIAVSYSIFDRFEIPKKTASFNYLYCGLKDNKGEHITDRGLLLRFHYTRKKIFEKGRTEQWINILKNFIEEESIERFVFAERPEKAVLDESTMYKFDLEQFGKVRDELSSGQSLILYIISEIVANIRYDSIVLYDEPETHLHPNAISQLINTIYSLVSEFESYCIIATHSPLIIRELISKNVFVIEREGRFSSIRKIGIESFGENLSILTSEVFGNRDIPKQYKKILKSFVDEGKDYEEIKQALEFDNIPLSINATVYLKSLLNDKSQNL